MKNKIIVLAAVIAFSFVFVAGDANAVTRDVTKTVKGKKGDTFVLDGKMNLGGDLNVAGFINGKSYNLKNLIGGKKKSTWKGTVSEICQSYGSLGNGKAKIKEEKITVTFTPTSATTGKWTSTPFNIFRPVVCDSSQNFMPKGNYSGSYRIIEGSLFATATKRNGKGTYSYNIIPQILGSNSMGVFPLGHIPAAYAVINKQ